MLFEAAPVTTLDFFNQVMSSTPLLSLWEVSGVVLGKNSSYTSAADTRAILPLPAVLVIIDAFLCARWDHWINVHVAQPYGVHIGARPKTQSLDITHSLHLIIEQGLDAKNGSAVAQSDILSYFDSLPVLRIAEWLLEKGAPPADVAALVRFHMTPRIRLRISDAVSVTIRDRSKGGLTGTRTALVLARIPVEATTAFLYPRLKHLGIQVINGGSLLVSTYIDNFYVSSPTQQMAVQALEAIENELVATWGLAVKPSSRQVLVATAGGSAPATGSARWPIVSSMPVLGHELSATGSVTPCWSLARAAMLRSYIKNSGSLPALDIPTDKKLILLSRATFPILAYRAVRWPPSISSTARIDTFQRKLAAHCIRTSPLPGEPQVDFCKRRNGIVSAHLPKRLRWSHMCCNKVRKWQAHLDRRHGLPWSADLLATPRAPVERAFVGRPTTRWREGLAYANASR